MRETHYTCDRCGTDIDYPAWGDYEEWRELPPLYVASRKKNHPSEFNRPADFCSACHDGFWSWFDG